MLFISLLLALLLDFLFAEPKRFHPLVGFGNLANAIERRFNQTVHSASKAKALGVAAVLIVLLPFTWLAWAVQSALADSSWLLIIVSAVVLYAAIGWQSLLQHGKSIADALLQNDMTLARQEVAKIVSRDCQALDEPAIAKAACESVLENGADAIFNAVFWFFVAGIPGVVLYRLSNTLDAMWGYKNSRFYYFGWAAARLDDVLNYIPARLSALLYALAGNTRQALHCWKTQAKAWKSPSAGVVMAAGAGALNIQLGGEAVYHGKTELRPPLGSGNDASAESIQQAILLINKALFILLVFSVLLP